MSEISCHIITIGDEILYGHILDTNSKWLSENISLLGLKISKKSTISDNYKEIITSVNDSIAKYNLTILTGGLGPTNDDVTKKCLNEYFDSKLVYDKKTLDHIKKIFKKRNLDFTLKNKQQALVPDKCKVLHNKYGTAPGMSFIKNKMVLISLPGVPFEMKSLFKDECIDLIKSKFKLPVIHHRIIKTVGIGESWLSDIISEWENNLDKSIKLAYLPSLGRVKLRLTGHGKDLKKVKSKIKKEEMSLIPLIKKYVFGFDSDELENVVGKQLIKENKDISVAESCTGGKVSSLLTSVPGSSKYFKGGIIAYSNEIKINSLEVPKVKIEKFGAVSREVIEEMAKKIRIKFKSSLGIASSGIAGPGGGTKDKPVGTVWIAIADKNNVMSKKLSLTDRRDVNITLSSISLLNIIRIFLEKYRE